MRRILCLAVLLVAGCAKPALMEPAGEPVIVMEETAPVVEAAPTDACTSGEGDGIGGTGCKLN